MEWERAMDEKEERERTGNEEGPGRELEGRRRDWWGYLDVGLTRWA